MRSGTKSYYNEIVIKSIFSKLILILLCGLFFHTILLTRKSKISLTINPSKIYENISIVAQNNVPIEYYSNIYSLPSTENLSDIFLDMKAMVIGDSTAEGLSAYGILSKESVVWTRGRCVQYMIDDMDSVIKNNPKVLFLSYGANDLLSWDGNVEGYIKAYSKILNEINTLLPNTQICVNSILPVSDEMLQKEPAYKYEKEFNTKLKSLCESLNIVYIDNRDLLKRNDNGKIYENDGVHPKPFYYKLWANNMINSINKTAIR